MTREDPLEAVLAAALRAPDPAAAIAAAIDDPALDTASRAALRAVDPDGVRLAALLVAKLRFERLRNGSERVAAWFARDPSGFTGAFRRYHQSVTPESPWPGDEAEAFSRSRGAGPH